MHQEMTSYWINTVSLEHVALGVEGGFTQADHGKKTRIRRLEKGDFIVFYSPRTELRCGEKLQAFTAIGRIADDEPFQVKMSEDFHPWRRRVVYFESKETSIRPLIERLGFLKNKKQWGYPFRRGLFEITRGDFDCIARAMGVTL